MHFYRTFDCISVNRQQILQMLSAALVPIGLVLAGLSVAQGDIVWVSLGLLTTLAGVAMYWGFGRYWEAYTQLVDDDVDFTTTRTFVLGLVQAGLAVVQFVLLLWVASGLGVVTEAAVNADPQSVFLAFSGVVPAVALGAGLPYFIQRFDSVRRLSDTRAARTLGPFLTFGTYFVLLGYHPVSGMIYALAYVGSRVAVLLGFYGGSRVQGAIT